MGASAVWHALRRRPATFAAGVAISAVPPDSALVPGTPRVPPVLMHGTADTENPYAGPRAARLHGQGGLARVLAERALGVHLRIGGRGAGAEDRHDARRPCHARHRPPVPLLAHDPSPLLAARRVDGGVPWWRRRTRRHRPGDARAGPRVTGRGRRGGYGVR